MRAGGGERRQLLRDARRARRAASDGLGYVLVSNQVTSKSNEAQRRTPRPRSSSSRPRRSRLHKLRPDQGAAPLSVSEIAESRFDWERFMRELARIMPARSWVQTADASTVGDSTGTPEPTADPAAGRFPDGQPRGLRARPGGHRHHDGPPAPALPRQRRGAQGVRPSRRPRRTRPARRRSTTAAPSTSSTSPSPSARPRPRPRPRMEPPACPLPSEVDRESMSERDRKTALILLPLLASRRTGSCSWARSATRPPRPRPTWPSRRHVSRAPSSRRRGQGRRERFSPTSPSSCASARRSRPPSTCPA